MENDERLVKICMFQTEITKGTVGYTSCFPHYSCVNTTINNAWTLYKHSLRNRANRG